MANLNLRVTDDERARLEQSAKRAGQTLTSYLLSWVPDTYSRTTEPDTKRSTTQRRGVGSD